MMIKDLIRHWNNKGRIIPWILLCSVISMFLALCYLFYPDKADSGPYLDSAHGNTSYGVDRTSLSPFGYSKGNCANCHEQHASIGGSEPDPVGGVPSKFALFYTNHTSQTDNFCYKCHTDINSLQTGSLVNRSYSYRAGGWTADTLNDILQAFSFYPGSAIPGSSHQLGTIRSFITARSWGYTNNSNPCAACHNPHRAQGDPENSPNGTKSSGTRGWPVSRPSQHSTDNNAWGLWGDDVGEKISDYAGAFTYMAPYYFNSTTTYEPEGSAINNGTNLTDYVTFCTDCHNPTYDGQISSQQKSAFTGGWQPLLYNPDWESTSPHGKIAAGGMVGNRKAPYDVAGINHVLSCTDCHEPHGSPNGMLIRREVNGSTTLVDFTAWSDRAKWLTLCRRCHTVGVNHQGASNPCWMCHMHNKNWFRPI
jgi:hypothetical protein